MRDDAREATANGDVFGTTGLRSTEATSVEPFAGARAVVFDDRDVLFNPVRHVGTAGQPRPSRR